MLYELACRWPFASIETTIANVFKSDSASAAAFTGLSFAKFLSFLKEGSIICRVRALAWVAVPKFNAAASGFGLRDAHLVLKTSKKDRV